MVWASLWQALPLFWHRDAVKADGSLNDDPGDYHGGIVIGRKISGKRSHQQLATQCQRILTRRRESLSGSTNSIAERLLINARVDAAGLTPPRVG
ncbi:MAG: hypothetical protein OXC07_03455 [Kistimonas sp.]|nr:hypothetical protein [Kistimonas sp.]